MKRKILLSAGVLAVTCIAYMSARVWDKISILPNQKQRDCYERVAVFMDRHPDLGNMSIDYLGQVRIENNRLAIDSVLYGDSAWKDFAPLGSKTIQELRNLTTSLKNSSTQAAQREGDMVLIYPGRSVLSLTGERAGYVYSSKGQDPNEFGGYLTTKSRPFRSIGDKWFYTSRIAFGSVLKN